MDQKKREKIAWVMAVVLTPVLIYLLAVNVFGTRKKPSSPPPPAPPPPVLAAPAVPRAAARDQSQPVRVVPVRAAQGAELSAEAVAIQRKIAEQAPARNPFIAGTSRPSQQPARPVVREESAPRVSGVVLSAASNTRMAIINGKMYEEGERFGDWTILKVSANEVVFGNGDLLKSVGVK